VLAWSTWCCQIDWRNTVKVCRYIVDFRAISFSDIHCQSTCLWFCLSLSLSLSLSLCLSVCLSAVFQNVSSPAVRVAISWYFNTMFSYALSQWSSGTANADLTTSAILKTSSDHISPIKFVFDSRCLLSAASEPHRLPVCLNIIVSLIYLWSEVCNFSSSLFNVVL